MILKAFSKIFILCCFLVATAHSFTVLASTNISIENLSIKDLRNIYLGKKTKLDDGTRIKAVMMQGGEVHELFINTFLKRSVKQFDFYWQKIIFAGLGVPPKSFKTEKDMIDYIKANPNIIGYTKNAIEGLRVIKVE